MAEASLSCPRSFWILHRTGGTGAVPFFVGCARGGGLVVGAGEYHSTIPTARGPTNLPIIYPLPGHGLGKASIPTEVEAVAESASVRIPSHPPVLSFPGGMQPLLPCVCSLSIDFLW